MEIIEKIQSTFDDVDAERALSIARTCSEMVTPIQFDLTFLKNDQSKLEIIQSKLKEAQGKIKEMAVKARYAVDLYNQHLDIEFKKQSNDQPFNIPVIPDETSIFKVEIFRDPNSEDEYNEVDHVECALINAQKAGEEFIAWTIFYSELEDMEQEINEGMDIDKKNELPETISSGKDSGEEIKIKKSNETGVSTIEPIVPTKFLQIFKEGGAELFTYIQSEYTIDDHSPVAKYSYIYRFLAQKQFMIARSQSKYRDFIQDTFGVKMSKIFRENYKYKEDIYPILRQIKSHFEKRNKWEINGK